MLAFSSPRLNEGFTRFVEGKIMQEIEKDNHGGDLQKGIEYKEFMAISECLSLFSVESQ